MNAPADIPRKSAEEAIGEMAADYGEHYAAEVMAHLPGLPELQRAAYIQLSLSRAYLSGALQGMSAARDALLRL